MKTTKLRLLILSVFFFTIPFISSKAKIAYSSLKVDQSTSFLLMGEESSSELFIALTIVVHVFGGIISHFFRQRQKEKKWEK